MVHKFKVGDRIVVTAGGIRNGWYAVVVPPFNWQKEVGAYKPVPSGYVYLRAVSDRYGEPKDELFTMPKNYIALAGEAPKKSKSHPVPIWPEFFDAYIEAALWSTTDNSTESGGYPLEDNYGPDDIDQESIDKQIMETNSFIDENEAWLDEASEKFGARPASLGFDFWLSRNGHGAGYFDRGYGALGDKLQNAAKVYGTSDIYVGDDRKLHFQ